MTDDVEPQPGNSGRDDELFDQRSDSKESDSKEPDSKEPEGNELDNKVCVDFVTVGHIDDVPDGEGRAFEVGESVIAIFNNGGQLQAIDDMCPHMGASLATGFYDGKTVTCPWHAWRFDTGSGAWCDNRRLKIPVYDVQLSDDGEIQVSETPRTIANDIEKRAGQNDPVVQSEDLSAQPDPDPDDQPSSPEVDE